MSTELKIKKAGKAVSEEDLKKIGGGSVAIGMCVENDESGDSKKDCSSD